MLHCAIISRDTGRSERLARVVESVGGFSVKCVLDEYPPVGELLRALRRCKASVLFLGFDDLQGVVDCTRAVEEWLPEIRIIGLHEAAYCDTLRNSMRLGIREPLWEPFDKHVVRELLDRVQFSRLPNCTGREPGSRLICFLPSKPGVGTSTVALGVSASLAARPGSSVLFADFDLSAGMSRFLLRLTNKSSVTHAVELAPELDRQLWPQLVTRRNGLDILHSGEVNPHFHAAPSRLEELLAFLRRTYRFVCADLSGNFEHHSLDLLQESESIYLVCAPEVASLHLAREKLDFLRTLDLEDRVAVILNRASKKSLFTTEQVQGFVGVPIAQVFENDYQGVHRAVMAGTVVGATSVLGKQFTQFAQRLAPPVATTSECGPPGASIELRAGQLASSLG